MSLPAWFGDGPDKRRQNSRSRAQEARWAARKGGRPQPGSGTRPGAPGDVRSEDDLTECKYTDGASYPLKVTLLRKILTEALRNGREPEFVVEFQKHNIRTITRIERIR